MLAVEGDFHTGCRWLQGSCGHCVVEGRPSQGEATQAHVLLNNSSFAFIYSLYSFNLLSSQTLFNL